MDHLPLLLDRPDLQVVKDRPLDLQVVRVDQHLHLLEVNLDHLGHQAVNKDHPLVLQTVNRDRPMALQEVNLDHQHHKVVKDHPLDHHIVNLDPQAVHLDPQLVKPDQPLDHQPGNMDQPLDLQVVLHHQVDLLDLQVAVNHLSLTVINQ